jgi:hypothetical protein
MPIQCLVLCRGHDMTPLECHRRRVRPYPTSGAKSITCSAMRR